MFGMADEKNETPEYVVCKLPPFFIGMNAEQRLRAEQNKAAALQKRGWFFFQPPFFDVILFLYFWSPFSLAPASSAKQMSLTSFFTPKRFIPRRYSKPDSLAPLRK
jgi:hypothetical protein